MFSYLSIWIESESTYRKDNVYVHSVKNIDHSVW